jgi:hypothetical protein
VWVSREQDNRTSTKTTCPLKAEALQECLDSLLRDHGLTVADIKWKEIADDELGLLRDHVIARD